MLFSCFPNPHSPHSIDHCLLQEAYWIVLNRYYCYIILEVVFKFLPLREELWSIFNPLPCFALTNIKESCFLTCLIRWRSIFLGLRLHRGLFLILFLDEIIEVIRTAAHKWGHLERLGLTYLLWNLLLVSFKHGFLSQLIEMFLKVEVWSAGFFPLSEGRPRIRFSVVFILIFILQLWLFRLFFLEILLLQLLKKFSLVAGDGLWIVIFYSINIAVVRVGPLLALGTNGVPFHEFFGQNLFWSLLLLHFRVFKQFINIYSGQFLFLCLHLVVVPVETIFVDCRLRETLARHHLLGLGVVDSNHWYHGASTQYLRDLIVFAAEMHHFLELCERTVFTPLVKV